MDIQLLAAIVATVVFFFPAIFGSVDIWNMFRSGQAKTHNVEAVLMATHVSRRAGWLPMGAVVMAGGDVVSGLMFIISRLPVFIVDLLLLVLGTDARPSAVKLCKVVGGAVAGLGAISITVYFIGTNSFIEWTIRLLLAVSFGVLIFYAMPKQIAAASVNGGRQLLPWYQVATLAKDVSQYLYSFYVEDFWTMVLMAAVYYVAVCQQLILVAIILRGNWNRSDVKPTIDRVRA